MNDKTFRVWLALDVHFSDEEPGDIGAAIDYVNGLSRKEIGEQAEIKKVEELE